MDEKEIKLNNFKAHYNSIVANIQDASKNLDSVFGEIEKANGTLSKVREVIKFEDSNLLKVLSRQEIVNGEIQNGYKDLDRARKSLEEERKAFVDYAGERKLVLDSIQTQIDSLSESLEELKKLKTLKEDEIKVLEAKEQEKSKVTQEIKSQEQELKRVKEEFISETLSKETRLKEICLKIKTAEGVLASVNSEITARQTALLSSKDSLKEWEQSLQEREKNITIIVGRLRTASMELFGSDLKI